MSTLTAKVGQWSPDDRQSGGAFFTGEGFTGGTLRYDASMTGNDRLTDLIDTLNRGYFVDQVPDVDWSKVGTNAAAIVESDKVIRAQLTIGQGPGGAPYARSECFAFAVKNPVGYSRTYFANRPEIYSLPGVNPSELYSGRFYPILGTSLSSTMMTPAVWLWDGKTPVALDQAKGLIPLPITQPGGRGTGNTIDVKRVALFFKVPASVPAGKYYLIVQTGDNRYSISDPKGFPVEVKGQRDPWLDASVGDLMSMPNGSDITTKLKEIVNQFLPSVSTTNRIVFMLPPGVFYLSESFKMPAYVGLIGSGKHMTRVTVNPNSDEAFGSVNSVLGRYGMFCLMGDSYFADMTLDLSGDESRRSARSIFAAGPNVNSVRCSRVQFENVTCHEKNGGYVDGLIYRFGQHQYWDFRNCDAKCGMVFEGTNGSQQSFAINGAFDNGLWLGGSLEGVYGSSTGSHLGSMFGRGNLVYGMKTRNTRRGLAVAPGDYPMRSAVVGCSYADMISEFGNLEAILIESRTSQKFKVTAATDQTITVTDDKTDRQRHVAFIADGKGQFQFRVIKSSAACVHTLEKPFEIVPDTTSLVMFCLAPVDCEFTWNNFQGSGGVTLFGSAFNCRINSNWFDSCMEAIVIDTNWDSFGAGVAQLSDGCQVNMFTSIQGNTFRDGCGIHVIACRTTADLAYYSFPQVAFLKAAFNQYRGDVVNQLYAGEGPEQKSNEIGPGIKDINLIQYVTARYDSSWSGPNYLHPTIAKTLLPRSVWFASMEGVANFTVEGHQIDNVPVKDQAALITTSAKTKLLKGFTINDQV